MIRLKDLWKHLGTGALAAISVDSYRRTLKNDGVINNKTQVELEEAKERANAAERRFNETAEGKVEYETIVQSRIASLKENFEERRIVESQLETATGEAKKYLVEKSKKLEKKIEDNIDDLVKSDLSDIFKNTIDNYYKFLDGLTLDQTVAFFNLIIDFSLGYSLFTIASLFMGEHIIDYFKLDIKYPKLASLIRLKININKHLKMFNLGIFILFLLAGIVGNIYMFLLKYFI